jgi:glycosyltransferase involved in cell wall biosynthesis
MNKITVFTPTYNRAYCLHYLYESLLRQTSKNFVWLVIDDGSTDNTRNLLQGWIDENKVTIKYHYKENEGMHTGHNVAHQLIDTELNVCIDSDDFLTDNAIERILHLWNEYGSDKFAGIVGLDAYKSGEVIGVPFPSNLKECTYSELKPVYGVTGDKKSVYRTEVIKKYKPYPTFKGEKFVPLYLPIVIDKDYKVLCFNEVFCVVDYQDDGSTLNMYRQYKKNARGFAQQRKVLMEYSPFKTQQFRNAIHYVSSSIFLMNINFLKESPKKIFTIVAFPFGVLLYFYIFFKTQKTQKTLK